MDGLTMKYGASFPNESRPSDLLTAYLADRFRRRQSENPTNDDLTVVCSTSWPVPRQRGFADAYQSPEVVVHHVIAQYPVYVFRRFWTYDEVIAEAESR